MQSNQQYPDLTGRVFTRLTVLSQIDHRTYLCKCNCGQVLPRRAYHLVTGSNKSCGCLKRDLTRAHRFNPIHRPYYKEKPLSMRHKRTGRFKRT